MDERPDSARWHDAALSALEWWRDAGVDVLVDDAPRDWTARKPAPAADSGRHPAAAIPDTLDALLAWRMGPDAPDAGWPGARIGPVIVPGATIAIVTDMPEADDAAAGALFSGAAGRLLDRMLAAIGLARGAVHLVPLAVVRPLGGVLPEGSEAAMRAPLLRLLELCGAERALALGETASRCLFAPNAPAARGDLAQLNLDKGRSIDLVVTIAPRMLLQRPVLKRMAWQDLQVFAGSMGQ